MPDLLRLRVWHRVLVFLAAARGRVCSSFLFLSGVQVLAGESGAYGSVGVTGSSSGRDPSFHLVTPKKDTCRFEGPLNPSIYPQVIPSSD